MEHKDNVSSSITKDTCHFELNNKKSLRIGM